MVGLFVFPRLCYYHCIMEHKLRDYINSALSELGITDATFVVERPADISHGDWATNAAMAGAKKAGKNPRALAEEIKAKIEVKKDADIFAIEIAGPGFINIKLSKSYFVRELEVALAIEKYGNNDRLKGKKVIVEYTDPNPFKEFHIGHLMSNTIGESISRIIEASGAETKRACYQGDVGLHVAKTMLPLSMLTDDVFVSRKSGTFTEQVALLGHAYKDGSQAYAENEDDKKRIIELNKLIYSREDKNINERYDWGRDVSLQYFEQIYERLGTSHGDRKAFNFYFFESETATFGKDIVEKHPEIFEKSDGAVVYKGDEAMGLHTRVFINKEGLPTYEAKELGLARIKYDTFPYDVSVVITGNEVNDYFKVLLDAMSKVFPDLAAKTEHYSHGMLRLPTGKMSSRTGDVITAESLIEETKTKALVKVADSTFSDTERDEVAERVAIGAIKYSILRQAAGKDIIFDFEQSLSFEGDSGPYLQYTYARTKSLLAKAGGEKVDITSMEGDEVISLHKYILRFPEAVLRAEMSREPHHIATYLIEVAREFNAFYANSQVIGSSDEGYKLALVQMTSRILLRGLNLLGITAPERM